jgi:excisionase family DNA binding protein
MSTLETFEPPVSVAEAAALLRVSRATTYRLVQSGELPAARVGGQLRIKVADVRAALDTKGTSDEHERD